MQYILVVLWPGGFFLGGGGEWTMITSKNCQFKFCKERQPVKPVKIYRILPDVTPIPYGHMDRFIHRCMCHMKWLPNTELRVYLFISSFWKKTTNEMKNMKRTFNFHAHSLICKKLSPIIYHQLVERSHWSGKV